MKKMSLYQHVIHSMLYAKRIPKRETYKVSVSRYMEFIENYMFANYKFLDAELFKSIKTGINEQHIMPSMRGFRTAGEALKKENLMAYNCAFTNVDCIKSFSETLYIKMRGVGVGHSVELKNIEQLPIVSNINKYQKSKTIIVRDSSEGWSEAYELLLNQLYDGFSPSWNTRLVRKSGAPISTLGVGALGPAVLENLFDYTCKVFYNAKGRKLSSLECHDILCNIAKACSSGSLRRAALISLSDLNDTEMMECKTGNKWPSYRSFCNNSAVFHSKPNEKTFWKEWENLVKSKSGERGIFNRMAARNKMLENGRRIYYHNVGTNPCSEILLRSRQLCNLTEVVVRPYDNFDSLKNKIYLASALGTFQSCLDQFSYLSKEWKLNCESERLLGVSLTGIFDNSYMINISPRELQELKQVAIDTNRRLSNMLGIKQSAAVTCIKPSGSVSQLVDSASGIHPRHSKYYIRNVRNSNSDALTSILKKYGIRHEPCSYSPDTTVFSFPIESPGTVFRNDIDPISHIKLVKKYQDFWCEHKPSVTISVKDDEWDSVGRYIYSNFDDFIGMAFLPYSNHVYKQAPYIEISKEEYFSQANLINEISGEELVERINGASENVNNLPVSIEYACSGPGGCEL